MAAHCAAMVGFLDRGAEVFDYGNSLRAEAELGGFDRAFAYPGFLPAYIRPLFCEGKGPFRWVALSGDPADIAATDRAVLEEFPDDEGLARWIRLAGERVAFQGLPARICWLGYGERHRLGLRFNEMVRRGEVSAPIVIGRDHLDSGSVASPYRETEAMADGSDAIADWPLLNALVNTSCGRDVGVASTTAAASASAARSTPGWSPSPTAPTWPPQKLERVLTDRPRHGRDPPRRRRLRPRRRGRRRARRAPPDDARSSMTCDIEGDFWRDGAVCVRGAVRAGARRPGRARRSTPTSPTSRRGPSGPAPTTTARSSRTSATGSGCRRCERFIETSGVAAIAAELMGSRTVRLYHDHVLVKEPGTRQRTPWHQDQPYYNVDGRQNASMWFPVDPVPRALDARVRRRLAPRRRGSCPARSSTTRPSGSPTARSPSCPTSTADPSDFRDPRLGARAGRRRVLPHAHAARAPAASAARTAGGCCRCASSATTSSTPRGRGRRRRRSPAWSTSCRPARRWTTRCSRSSGRCRAGRRRPSRMNEPIDYVELPGGDLPATKEFYAIAFGWSFTDYGPEYASHRRRRARRRLRATTRPAGTPPLIILKSTDLRGHPGQRRGRRRRDRRSRSSSSRAARASTSAIRPATSSACGAE